MNTIHKKTLMPGLLAVALVSGASAATSLISLDFDQSNAGGGTITAPAAPEVTSFTPYTTVEIPGSTTLRFMSASMNTITLDLSGAGLPSSMTVAVSSSGSSGTYGAATNTAGNGVISGISTGQPGLGIAGNGGEINVTNSEQLIFTFNETVLVAGFTSGFWDNAGGLNVTLPTGSLSYNTAAVLNNVQTFTNTAPGFTTLDGVSGVLVNAGQSIRFGALGTDNGVISGLSFYVPGTPVPEPTTLTFSGFACLGLFRRRRS